MSVIITQAFRETRLASKEEKQAWLDYSKSWKDPDTAILCLGLDSHTRAVEEGARVVRKLQVKDSVDRRILTWLVAQRFVQVLPEEAEEAVLREHFSSDNQGRRIWRLELRTRWLCAVEANSYEEAHHKLALLTLGVS